MIDPKILKLPEITAQESDVSGRIVVLSVAKILPFEVRRSYWIHGMQLGERRGHHAHRSLCQGMVAISGEIEFCLNDGKHEERYVLRYPDEILIVPPGYWREFTAKSEGAVLMVFASAEYEESDYIRSFDDFVAYKSCT